MPASVACDLFMWDQEPPEGPVLSYVLPEGFSGWACTDFGVAGAQPLSRDGEAFVIQPEAGVVVQTSDSPANLLFARTGAVLVETAGGRRSFPATGFQATSTDHDTKHLVARHCVFFGTEEEHEAAGEAPTLIRDTEPVACTVPE